MKLFNRISSRNPLDVASWDDFENFLQQTRELGRAYPQAAPPPPGRPVVIFGAAVTGVQLFLILEQMGWKVDYLCDNNPNVQHTYVQHLHVLSPADLAALENPFIIIASRWGDEIKAQLAALNLQGAVILSRDETDCLTGPFLASSAAFYLEHLEELKAVFSRLADDESRYVFINVIRARLLLYEQSYHLFSKIMTANQYWCLPRFRAQAGLVYADVGAGRGETIETFLFNNPPPFEHIYAFEPDPDAFRQLKKVVGRLGDSFDFDPGRVTFLNSGLGARENKAVSHSVHQNQQGRSGDEFELHISAIDTALAGRGVDLIKADIEGYELDMLKGGLATLQERKPRLALSLYHRPEDFFTLPLYISEKAPVYKLAVRHHLNTWYETVLYAWV